MESQRNKQPKEFRSGQIFTPDDGGVFIEVYGWKYPVKGYPMETAVETLAVIKGLVPLAGFAIKELIKFPPPFTFIAFNRISLKVLRHFAKVLKRQKAKNTKRYCRPVRELWYAFQSVSNELAKEGETNDCMQCIRDIKFIVCVGIEFDSAYRYRVQHAIQYLNKIALIKHPIRELRRLFDVLAKNENMEGGDKRWKYVKFLMTIFLLFNPRTKKALVRILNRLNLEELKLEDDDWFMIAMRNNDYNFKG